MDAASRCRNRRTVSSQARQSTAPQSRVLSSGPFITPTAVVVASNLSFGSGASVIFLLTGSPDRVSTLSRPGTRPDIRPVIRKRPAGGASHHVPVSRCLSTADIRFSAIRFTPGIGPSLRSAYRIEDPDPDGATTFHTHELRPGSVPPIPRGRRCSPGRSLISGRRLPLLNGQSLHPATASHRRGLR